MRKALVIIDMQNDFVFGALGSNDAQNILPAVKARIERGRIEGEEIVFTRDTHEENYLSTSEGKRLPVPHCIKHTHGWEIVDGLHRAGEKIFDKPTFGSVELARFLTEKNFDEVTFCGVCTDICVVSNVLLYKAHSPEKAVRAIESCMAGTSKQAHDAAVLTMRSCQVEIV